MKVTLLDEQGVELTKITSHLGRSPGQMLVDWATRPDALFQYYFDRGSRSVTAVIGAAKWSAVLGTRWQMGARRWFLHTFNPVGAAQRRQRAHWTQDSGLVVAGIRSLRATDATATHRAPAIARTSEPRGVPA
ncbi:MAG: hypothetical protein ACYDEB_14230 [Dehalococcoidia bacterium]